MKPGGEKARRAFSKIRNNLEVQTRKGQVGRSAKFSDNTVYHLRSLSRHELLAT